MPCTIRIPWLALPATVLLFLSVVSACRDPFVPDLDGFADLLVVEGRVTNDSAGSLIRLSRSTGLASDTARPVTGARVWFERPDGFTYQLAEAAPGRYRSAPVDFFPQLGDAYRLRIVTPDNEEIVSTYETMKTVPQVGSLGYELVYQQPDAVGAPQELGAQFFLNTTDPDGNTRLYQWTWEAVWEIYVPYPIIERWTFEPSPQAVPLEPGEETQRCFRSASSSNILIADTRQLEEDVVRDFPLEFVPFSRGDLFWTYSLNVRQFALSESEYAFLNNIRLNNEATGSIFDPIPTELHGNLRNLSDSTKPVIGFFGASAVSTERTFFTGSDYHDSLPILKPFRLCETTRLPLDIERLRVEIQRNGMNWLDTLRDPFGNPVGFLVARPICSDCQLSGSPEKPAYWPN